jgi:aromatic-L-amino-acid/L-tryptophan decarboxylase
MTAGRRRDAELQARAEGLDPEDWDAAIGAAHGILDDCAAYLRDVRNRPVWRPVPSDVAAAFEAPPPPLPQPLSEVWREVATRVMPYPMGNIHPRFWSWYMGASNFTGALGDFIAAVQGSNLGGGAHAAALLDRQVVDWLKAMVGFPKSASGTLVSGGSMANIIALAVARNVKAGIDVRELGVAPIPKPLAFYGSDQLHSCHRKAMEALGLGNRTLRRIATDQSHRIDLAALKTAIAADRAEGFEPACVIATAGTVNTGAIDDLEALATLAGRENLWLHVDGCIGALLAIAPKNAWRVAGIDKADSIALDPHKWLHAPFEAGCALVKDAAAHRNTFAVHPEYLESSPRGLASGEWLHDYGLQTSRGFRALKIWMALKEHGVEKFGRLIDQDIAHAHRLSAMIEAEPELELVAPTNINIVCFRHRLDGADGTGLKAFNAEIMFRLQEEGIACVSDTTVHGEYCLRAAINNHRTRVEDLEVLVRETVRLGRSMAKAQPPS